MSTPLIYIPIEPLSERYTEQWYRRFPEAFNAAGFKTTIIDGVPLLTDEIKVGSFLDINSTVHYKMSQLQAIAAMFHRQEVASGTIFFFGDVEFWGLESVRLMADMNGIPIKMVGFLHAASYTKEDAFAIAAPYQQYTELGWISALDAVYVGSEYHKEQFQKLRLKNLVWLGEVDKVLGKIIPTGNPIFADEYPVLGLFKENKILLTNRLDEEKRPYETLQLFEKLHKSCGGRWKFVVTTGRKNVETSANVSTVKYMRDLESRGIIKIKAGLTKAEYHRELETAKIMVSHSIEENYGYCIAEALHYRCTPVLRAGLSHDEFLASRTDLLFGNKDEAFNICANIMQTPYDTSTLPKLDCSGLDKIIKNMKELT